jgi:hypothetical protein
MKRLIVAIFLALVNSALAVPIPSVRTSDALSQYDEVIISSEIQNECHFKILGSLSEEKLNVIGTAARGQMWRRVYDHSASTQKNWSEADKMMLKRTQDDEAQGKELVNAQGCEKLVPRAREVLTPYSQ